MRLDVTVPKLNEFMEQVGKLARGPGSIYLTGGSTALLLGIREQTIDIDIKLDPEPAGVFEAIALLKERLSLNVELASPDQFVPAIPGWRERSIFIGTSGLVSFFHYDLYGQALSKIERGHEKDIADVRAVVNLNLIDVERLIDCFAAIEPELVRYPAIDPGDFKRRVDAFVAEIENSDG